MITEVAWVNRNNAIDLLLTADSTAQAIASITKYRLVINPSDGGPNVTVYSSASATIFSTGDAKGKLTLQLGGVSRIKTGLAILILYDATNTSGIVWGQFRLMVGNV